MNGEVFEAFAHASQFLVETTAAVPDDAWPRPGLGTFSVLELVAHANRAHTTTVEYLLHPQEPQPPGSPYFAPEAVARRTRDSVAAIADDPAGAVAAASADVVALVARTAADAPLAGPAGTTTLAAYLPSRVAELVLHGLDLAAAIGITPHVPEDSLAVAGRFVAGLAFRKDPLDVLLALTGRGALPDGFSVY